jgi:hypothetical protein
VTFGLWAAFIGYILMLIGVGVGIIVIIIGQINSPKLDMDRLNALTKQYMDEMTRNPPSGPPGGVPGF